jgi:hypothetical protein
MTAMECMHDLLFIVTMAFCLPTSTTVLSAECC